jgi:hypothetical protein
MRGAHRYVLGFRRGHRRGALEVDLRRASVVSGRRRDADGVRRGTANLGMVDWRWSLATSASGEGDVVALGFPKADQGG